MIGNGWGDVVGLVLRRDGISGSLAVAGDVGGYRHGEQDRAVRDAVDASQLATELGRPVTYSVLRITAVDAAWSWPERWLWSAEMSYSCESWTQADVGGVVSAGVTEGPDDADAAARMLLQNHLARLGALDDDYNVEDDWWRLSIWRGGRLDETQGPLRQQRLQERADGMPQEHLYSFTRQLRADHCHPDAVAVATPRQGAHMMADVPGSPART